MRGLQYNNRGIIITFKDSKKTFIMNKNLRCNLKNVIYMTECENCKQTYIGCTKNFNNRISLHKSNIKIKINKNYLCPNIV